MTTRHQQQQLLPIVIIIIEHVFIYLIIYNMFVPTLVRYIVTVYRICGWL